MGKKPWKLDQECLLVDKNKLKEALRSMFVRGHVRTRPVNYDQLDQEAIKLINKLENNE